MGEAYSALETRQRALLDPRRLPIPSVAARLCMRPLHRGRASMTMARLPKSGPSERVGTGIIFLYGPTTQTDNTSGLDIGSFTPNAWPFRCGMRTPSAALRWRYQEVIRSQILDTAQTAPGCRISLTPPFAKTIEIALVQPPRRQLKFDQEATGCLLRCASGRLQIIRMDFRTGRAFHRQQSVFRLGTGIPLATGKHLNLAGRAGFNSLTVKDVAVFRGFRRRRFDFNRCGRLRVFFHGGSGLTHRSFNFLPVRPRPVPQHTIRALNWRIRYPAGAFQRILPQRTSPVKLPIGSHSSACHVWGTMAPCLPASAAVLFSVTSTARWLNHE